MLSMRSCLSHALRAARAAVVALAAAGLVPAQAAETDGPLILVAKRQLRDDFYSATILIAAPTGNGRHMGFIINRPTPMTLGKLFPGHEPSQKVTDPVYLGGPFVPQFIFAVVQGHARPGAAAMQMTPELFVTMDREAVDRIIETESDHARFFAGVVAWQAGELREELKRGLWHVLEPETELVMRKPTEGLWEELVQRSERRANQI
jgi:putative transcriptional regulator